MYFLKFNNIGGIHVSFVIQFRKNVGVTIVTIQMLFFMRRTSVITIKTHVFFYIPKCTQAYRIRVIGLVDECSTHWAIRTLHKSKSLS